MSDVSWFQKERVKYCEKHDQEYMSHVRRCPICVGEEMAKNKEEDLTNEEK